MKFLFVLNDRPHLNTPSTCGVAVEVGDSWVITSNEGVVDQAIPAVPTVELASWTFWADKVIVY